MSDFERTFGEGADILKIVEEINDSIQQDRPSTYAPEWFETYAEASEWAKRNPGQLIKRHPVAGYERIIKAKSTVKATNHIWSIDPDAREIPDSASSVWGYWKSMNDQNESPEKIEAYLRDVVKMNGVSLAAPMNVPQPPLHKIVSSLTRVGMGLTPLSRDYCLIERLPSPNEWAEVLAVLITDEQQTTLWGYIDFQEVYDALVCKVGPTNN